MISGVNDLRALLPPDCYDQGQQLVSLSEMDSLPEPFCSHILKGFIVLTCVCMHIHTLFVLLYTFIYIFLVHMYFEILKKLTRRCYLIKSVKVNMSYSRFRDVPCGTHFSCLCTITVMAYGNFQLGVIIAPSPTFRLGGATSSKLQSLIFTASVF